MGLLDFLFRSSDDDYDDDLDTDLLYELGEHWVEETASDDDDEINEYRREAIDYIEEESGGSFWSWLFGG